nr:hypothetical protein CcurKRNrm3_p066 [Cryptomonas curvata]
MKIIRIIATDISKKFYIPNDFFKKFLDKNLLIFGNDNCQKKAFVNFLIMSYCRSKNKFYNNGVIKKRIGYSYGDNYIKIIFPNKKNDQIFILKFLINKLSNLSKFKKNNFIIILYHISILNKATQRKLFSIIEKYLTHFFFIFIVDSLKKIITRIKHKTFCFPISKWAFFWKEKQNIIKKKKFKTFLDNKNYFKIKNIFLKLNLSSMKQLFKFFFSIINFEAIFFFFLFKNCVRYNIFQDEIIKSIAEHCFIKVFLKKLLSILNLYEIKYFLSITHLHFIWKKTIYLITFILYKCFCKNTRKF